MSDTPQTDAAVEAAILQDRNHPRIDWVPASFARELERERNDLMSQDYRTEARAMRYCQERDEARNAIVGWETKWKCAIDMAARAELERDEALEDAKKYHIKMVNLINERNDARELAQQMYESNQVLQAEVRDYRKKETAKPFYKY